ncbi:hypothetical protein ACFVT1_15315 [Streptomyces sp. NPDC057963]|uniref:hypothetical protein n=1 Tax=Streptomyces sp. NPDC057963 TaxID=3346290 RepID=UPI0036EE9803
MAEVLHNDPAGLYDHCDEPTRRLYEHVILELANRSGKSVPDTARAAVKFCSRRPMQGEERETEDAHIGWALIGAGRPEFLTAIGCRLTWRDILISGSEKIRSRVYLGVQLALSAALVWAAARFVVPAPSSVWGFVSVLLLVPLMIPLSKSLLMSLLQIAPLPVRPLPRLEWRDGVPAECFTCVASPVIVQSERDIASALETVERNQRGNSGPNIVYALLMDLPDSDTEWTDADSALVEFAERTVHEMNQSVGSTTFHVLVRRRLWNARERVWMGWERKRGKLEEFNRIISGAWRSTSFILDEQTVETFRTVTYVLTLDADARLQQGGVRKLVGTLAHPLNSYVILRPGSEYGESGGLTRFQLATAGRPSGLYDASHNHTCTGSRPATYQDYMGRDLFLGLGVYHVRTFMAALDGRIPENSVLSHDKLEGMHTRVGYVPDVVYLECPPQDYLTHRRRHHRWVRGDFHLLPWILATGRGKHCALGALNRWHLLNDLMEHLRGSAAIALLAVGWLTGPATAVTLIVLLALNATVLLRSAVALLELPGPDAPRADTVSRVGGTRWHTRMRTARAGFAREAVRRGLWLVFLCDYSLSNADAVLRSLYRSFVSRRKVLEWTASASDSRTVAALGPARQWRMMAAAPALSLCLLAAVAAVEPGHVLIAAPFLLSWCVAPWLAAALAVPVTPGQSRL